MNKSLTDRIRTLQTASAALEPDSLVRRAAFEQVARHSESFLDELATRKAYISEQHHWDWINGQPGEEPGSMAAALDWVKANVDRNGIDTASGRDLGYIPGGGQYFSALGDYIADVSNRYSGVAYASPGATYLEKSLIRWFAGVIGFPEDTGGDLTSGGSIANLIAIVSARDAKEIQPDNISRSVVYLGVLTHHCVDKALRIAGLGCCEKRIIPIDTFYRMDAGALEKAIIADRKAGLNPWLVIASAGNVDAGAIDPLPEIACLAQKHGLWMHTDGAYGALFMLCETGRARLKGIEQSDSIVMDPHKTLFLPYGSGIVLVKSEAAQHRAHAYDAAYLADTKNSGVENVLDPSSLSPELTRPFRGMRLWLPLKLAGVSAFRSALEEKLLLAQYAYQKLAEVSGFELGPKPDLSVVTFRYIPEYGDANEFNIRLLDATRDDGRIFLSSTTVNGKMWIRFAIVVFRTHLDDIDLALDIVTHEVKRLEKTD